MINLSVDSPDPRGFNRTENLTYNDQESIIEIIVEKVFGFTNFFSEFDDDDSSISSIGASINLDHCRVEITGFSSNLFASSIFMDRTPFLSQKTCEGFTSNLSDPPDFSI